VTAANASSISDGAAALVMTRQSWPSGWACRWWPRWSATPPTPTSPEKFTTAPVPAMQKALAKAGWTVDDVDLFEVNEAFAVVAMIAMRDLTSRTRR
jgi:acetyl-CoA C-acetyltransferase